jgi:acetylornithine deacetylase
VDRRLLPGETSQSVQDELRGLIASLSLRNAVAEIGDFLFSAPFEVAGTDLYTQTFLEMVQFVLGTSPGPIGYLPGSDAKHLINSARQGIVVFGPGSYDVAHASNEFVEVKELEEAARILERFARTVLMEEQ